MLDNESSDKEVGRAVQRVVDSQKRYLEGMVSTAVERAMAADIKKRIDEGVTARLNAAAALKP